MLLGSRDNVGPEHVWEDSSVFSFKIWWFCFKCSKSVKSKLPAICLLDNYLVLTIKTKLNCCAPIAVYQAVINSQIILNLLLALLSAGLCTVCLFHRSEWVREEKYMYRLNREQKMAHTRSLTTVQTAKLLLPTHLLIPYFLPPVDPNKNDWFFETIFEVLQVQNAKPQLAMHNRKLIKKENTIRTC